MYDIIHPKEAIELYILLNFDINDTILQDIFYLLYKFAAYYERDISKIVYKIKNILLENNSMKDIEEQFSTSSDEKFKNIYFDLPIKNKSTMNQYSTSYETIKKVYLTYDLDNLISKYNDKQMLYTILDNISSTDTNSQYKESVREQFYNLIDSVSNYTDENTIEGYKYYFENKDNILMKFLVNKQIEKIQFHRINQVINLQNREKHAKKLSKKDLHEHNIPSSSRTAIRKLILKSLFIDVIAVLFMYFYFRPDAFYKEAIKSSNTNLMLPTILFLIISICIILHLFINVIRLIITIKQKIKSIDGYISDSIYLKHHNGKIIYIYCPSCDKRISIESKNFTSKKISKMSKVMVVLLCSKYIVVPIISNNECK